MGLIKVDTYKIPSYFLSALVNSDETGLEERDSIELNSWLSYLPKGYKVWDYDHNSEAYFSWSNDVTNYGADVTDTTLYMDEKDVKNWENRENVKAKAVYE